MFSSRYINKLRQLKYGFKANPKSARKSIVVKVFEEDAEELSTVEREETIKDEILEEAFKVVTAAGAIEACFKTIAIIDSYEKEGPEKVDEKFKSSLEVSGYDASDTSIQEILGQIDQTLQETEEEIRKLSYGNGHDFSNDEE